MITRILQDITLRKYNTAFIEAWGMIPLTDFGAIGDNRTDNYANIQVVIDETIRRKLRYIYVPAGLYYYTGKLLHLEDVMFVGNGTARIFTDDEEIEVHQLGTEIPFLNGTTICVTDESIETDGEIEIPVNIPNPQELYITVKNQGPAHTPETIQEVKNLAGYVLHVINGKIIFGDTIYAPDYDIPSIENRILLSKSGEGYVYLSNVVLMEGKIKLEYKVVNGGAKLSKRIDWSVR